MKLTKKLLIWFNACAVFVLILFVIISKILTQMEYKCVFASKMFMYCPGCGGTRAVSSLLHFDILSAMKYNIIVPIMLVLYIYYNIVAIISIKKKEEDFFTNKRLIPIYVFIGVIVLNFILRNVLLWGFGIDIIGDFLS